MGIPRNGLVANLEKNKWDGCVKDVQEPSLTTNSVTSAFKSTWTLMTMLILMGRNGSSVKIVLSGCILIVKKLVVFHT